MLNFHYLRPTTLQDAICLVETLGEKAKMLAGGTDLLIQMKRGLKNPNHIVSLNAIGELNKVIINDKTINIGALTTLSTIETEELIKGKIPILAETAPKMASPQIRNLATIGGNLCNASPSADMAPPLIALDASVKVIGKSGERTILLEKFFTGPGKTLLKNDEILTQIIVPILPSTARACYIKQSVRKAHDITMVGIGVMINSNHDGTQIKDVKIALGAVAPTPIRAIEAEMILKSNRLDDKVIEQAAITAAENSQPIDDIRSSAMYRKTIVKVLVKRAVKQLLMGGGNVR